MPEGDGFAVGAPGKAVANVEFFFVDPVGGTVDDGGRAVLGELGDFCGGEVFGIDVVGVEADEGEFGIVGREFGEHEG